MHIFTSSLKNKNIMTTLTINQVQLLTECIYVRFELKGGFKPLTGFHNNLFLTMADAKQFVRDNYSHVSVQLSTYEQALMGNAQWDNL